MCTVLQFIYLKVSNEFCRFLYPAPKLSSCAVHVQVLNNILRLAEVEDSPPFTPASLHNVTGFPGKYSVSEFTLDDHKALAILRKHFRKDQEDLKALVDMLYPDLNFTVQLESDP